MRGYQNILLWCFGIFVLWLIIQLPVNQISPNYKVIPQPLAGQTIVIDPGHGGPDGGAKGKGDVDEKGINLKVSLLLRDYLQQAGAIVYVTREEDKDLAQNETKGLSRRKSEDIRKRLEFIHDKEADFFLSIHLNAIPDPRWSGAQTFYYDRFKENKHLAEMIQSELIINLKNTDRTPLQMDTVYLLKHAGIPGALVELGFLSNERERELLQSNTYQSKLAASVYQGIIRYIMEDAESE